MLLGALQGGFQVFRSAFRDPASGLVEVFIAGVYRGGRWPALCSCWARGHRRFSAGPGFEVFMILPRGRRPGDHRYATVVTVSAGLSTPH